MKPSIINIYINPDHGTIHIESEEEDFLFIEIKNSKGHVMFSKESKVSVKEEVDISEYPVGIYSVMAKTKDDQEVEEIMVFG